jgi:hypothetical protein
MPFIPGQTPGMIAGILMVVSFTFIYIGVKFYRQSVRDKTNYSGFISRGKQAGFSTEFSKELNHKVNHEDKNESKDDSKI